MILCFISFVWNKWSVLHYKNTIKEKYRSINRSRVLEFEVRVLYIIKQIREMNLNSQLTFFFFFFKVCFPYDGLRLHFFFFARREKRTRESTRTVGRSNLHDTEFSFIAINMNEHRSPLKESSTFFSVSHVTLPLYMYIDILGFLQLVNVAKKNRKKKKHVFSIWIDRFANIVTF